MSGLAAVLAVGLPLAVVVAALAYTKGTWPW
jgi:hypothetical protein